MTADVVESVSMLPTYPKNLEKQGPKKFLGKKFGRKARYGAMRTPPPESNDAVAERLKLLRSVVSGENQTAFASRLGIEVRRWNNFERAAPLSKEVAFLIVKKFPDVTLDWLWLGIESGLPVRFQRELAPLSKLF